MPFPVLALLLAIAPELAETTYLEATVQPPIAIVERGQTVTFQTTLANPGVVRASDIRLTYAVDRNATIESLGGHAGWDCSIEAGGKKAECTKPSIAGEAPEVFSVVVRTGANAGEAATLTMAAESRGLNLAVAGADAIVQSFQHAVVDTTADSGPGSLRSAIETANAAAGAVRIEFRLSPVPQEGWFTFVPESPLPPITADRVFLDGTSQTRFTGDTNPRGPEIAIDGRRAHRGLEIHSSCLALVEGLVIGNFDEKHGLWFTQSRPCPRAGSSRTDIRFVQGNYIGTDPTGTVAWPNYRGIRGDFGSGVIRNNLIGGNTLSGLWIWATAARSDAFLIDGNRFGVASDGVTPLPNGTVAMLFGDRVSADVRANVIANHPGMGIALVPGQTFVAIQQNAMRDNGGIGIDWGIDGVSRVNDSDRGSEPNAPALLSATYSAATDRTTFQLATTSEDPRADVATVTFDFYANRGPDGDGEEWLGADTVFFRTSGSYIASLPGDHRGKWINATITRTLQPGLGHDSTSEFSRSIRAE
jgi:hypothetical protein